MKVLYLTMLKVPYRTKFFNLLSKDCDLTVLYDEDSCKFRNDVWMHSVRNDDGYDELFLNDKNFYRRTKELKRILEEPHDAVIVGCYNSFIEMAGILMLRAMKKQYILNLDGEIFLKRNSWKSWIKRFFLRHAQGYAVAGERAAYSVEKVVNCAKIFAYPFTSLTEEELRDHAKKAELTQRRDFVLVLGQYEEYKGLDIALEAAQRNHKISYVFAGMNQKAGQFQEKVDRLRLRNVKVIPFLQKEELEQMYLECCMLVLPSRQECWGLVINEAASYGTPIISTWGSGAAVEFLSERYSQFLAKPGDAEDLYARIRMLWHYAECEKYQKYLLAKSRQYSIEKMVARHLTFFDTL